MKALYTQTTIMGKLKKVFSQCNRMKESVKFVKNNRCYEISDFHCFYIIDNPCAVNHSNNIKITPIVFIDNSVNIFR